MRKYKALKLEVQILTEASDLEEDIVKGVEEALDVICEFDGVVVFVKERFGTIVADLDHPAEA